MMLKKTKKNLLILVIIAILATLQSACAPTLDNRGAFIKKYDLEKITVGYSTKEDVIKALGSPSTVSSFYDDTWYYIGNITESLAFLEPEVKEQQLIEFKFDENQVVSEMNFIDPKLARNIDPVGRETETAGKELNFIQQLVGNVGKFNKKDDKPKATGN